jgi:hypothetical protein
MGETLPLAELFRPIPEQRSAAGKPRKLISAGGAPILRILLFKNSSGALLLLERASHRSDEDLRLHQTLHY